MKELKLGKKKFKEDKRDLKLEKYFEKEAVPPVPQIYGHQNLISTSAWGMLGNDSVGDCVIAAAAHRTMLWTAEGSKLVKFSAGNTLKDYSAITGYNPDDPNSDQGTEIREALKYNQKTGMLDANGNRHKIGPYAIIDPKNINLVKTSTYLFSNIDIGFEFPHSAMLQFDAGVPWQYVADSQIEGGHGVPIVAYDPNYAWCVTWGKLQPMTWEFFNAYVDEAWLAFSTEYLKAGVSPEGFDQSKLNADYAELTGKPIPVPDPTPSPTPDSCVTAMNNVIMDITQAQRILKPSRGKYVVQARPFINKALKDAQF